MVAKVPYQYGCLIGLINKEWFFKIVLTINAAFGMISFRRFINYSTSHISRGLTEDLKGRVFDPRSPTQVNDLFFF